MKHVKTWLNVVLVLAILYLVLNLGVLLWFWINPDGFWGFIWFFTLFSGLFYVLYIGLMVLASFFTGKKGWRRWVYGVLFGVLAIVLIGVEQWPVFFISKKLSDKYQYIEKSAKYFKQGKYEEAYDYSEELYQRSLKEYDTRFWVLRYLFLKTEFGQRFLKERQYGSKINYAYCLTRLGLKSDKADKVFRQCEQIARNYFPHQPDFLLLSLGGRSNLYYRRGDIVKSERIYNEISRHLQSLREQDRRFMVNIMLMRVQHLQRHGSYEKAHQTINEALALYDLEEEEPETGTFLQLAMTGAQSNMIRGNWEKAGDLLQMAEPIARDRKKNLSYLEFLTLNGRLLEAKGLQDEAEETFLEMVEHSRDKSDVVYSKNLIQLAGFYLRQKKYPEAAEFFKKSAQKQPENQTEIRLKKRTAKGPFNREFCRGDIDQAINLMQSADSSSFNSVEDYLQVLDTEQKEKYLLKVQSHFDIANALYVASPNRDLTGYVYNNILLTKGLAFFSTRHIERFLDKANHQDLKQRLKKIKAAKKEVEEKLLKQFPENDRLLEKRDSLVLQERDFMQHLMGLEEYKTFDPFNVSWEHVRASLDTGEVAVEFFHGPESPLMLDTDRYFACIVEKSSAQPEIVPLFKAGKLDELLKDNQGGKLQVNNLYQGDNRDELYNMIFEPLSSMLKDKDKVYLSLSGLLYQVSIPALTIDKPYEAEMLTSTRSFVNDLKKTGNPGRVVAMGDIEYDEVAQRARNDAEQTYSSQRNKEFRHYQNLPGTKKEITHIAQLLGEREIPVQVISGKNGTEEAFRNMEGMDTDIIHLAAHGFHYPPANSVVMMERLYGVDDYLSDVTNPMLRSGLLFSKTNEKLEGDGVITANEIAAMDFSGVELVVLSTCQSGLGDVMGSEGVFGLQRAFKMAGVEKMIVSLWKVPDEATAELMAKFYDNYLSGDDANRALKKAQMTVRDKYVDPFYWAGFCVVN